MDNLDPIVHPTFVIDGKSVEVKLRHQDLKYLKGQGIDVFKATNLEGFEIMDRITMILQAGLRHSGQLSTDDVYEAVKGNFNAAVQTVAEALKKAAPQVTPVADQTPVIQ